MYNFLVSGKKDAWDFDAYEYDRKRFGEYTLPALKERFKNLTPEVIEELKSYPAMFAYEGYERDVRVGHLLRIKERTRSVLIEYEFDPNIPAIPFAKIKDLKSRLDIETENYEMSRTHWAVKDENLFEILYSAGLIDETFLRLTKEVAPLEEMRFKVALSFPGEKRRYVSKIAKELKKRLPKGCLFYDKEFAAQLARPNLDVLLQRVYSSSDLVVVFLCAEYDKKEWCGLEWRAIREIIKRKSDRSLMLMRFDDTTIPGLFSIDGSVDLRECSLTQAVNFILERSRLGEPRMAND